VVKRNNGCDYGKANRTLLEKYFRDFDSWRTNDFHHFQANVERKLDRPPIWVTLALSFFSASTVGLLVAFLTLLSKMKGVTP